ncbi:hypothetical protein [Enterococcus faecalis]|uniref:hypothetical protein n=1 Tax=Enterococcus faecalis TaxID=1351 RepID=UPI003D0902DB
MTYVVKISAYLGKDGRPVANLKDAVLFGHKETAAIANGTYSKRGKSNDMSKMQGTDDCLGKR